MKATFEVKGLIDLLPGQSMEWASETTAFTFQGQADEKSAWAVGHSAMYPLFRLHDRFLIDRLQKQVKVEDKIDANNIHQFESLMTVSGFNTLDLSGCTFEDDDIAERALEALCDQLRKHIPVLDLTLPQRGMPIDDVPSKEIQGYIVRNRALAKMDRAYANPMQHFSVAKLLTATFCFAYLVSFIGLSFMSMLILGAGALLVANQVGSYKKHLAKMGVLRYQESLREPNREARRLGKKASQSWSAYAETLTPTGNNWLLSYADYSAGLVHGYAKLEPDEPVVMPRVSEVSAVPDAAAAAVETRGGRSSPSPSLN